MHCAEICFQNKPHSLQSVFPHERGQTAQLQCGSSVWVGFSQTVRNVGQPGCYFITLSVNYPEII